ncbi:MBL fold metallo-hydrolase [Donghicola sp. XS_ASV15]|uniref:MBL fold metallo-hydrolase n=1 Tax=Donghicola sp. XS_ASV15 TaxID=3241295 RepID=UPI0035196B17
MSDPKQRKAGQVVQLETDLRCILAPNPSPMTYTGTNTYLLGTTDICVIDPGPADDQHLTAILTALEPSQRISAILCTHAHLDHTPLCAALKEATGAPTYGFGTAFEGESARMSALRTHNALGGGEGIDAHFAPDIRLADGAQIEIGSTRIEAVWTPGHLSNHVCFRTQDRVFSGDHVMGWATSMISPPDGDLEAFMTSLVKLKCPDDRVFYPGHGAPVFEPSRRIDDLYEHRMAREVQIMEALAEAPGNAEDLARRIYADIDAALIPAATRNVLAHLIALEGRGTAKANGPISRNTTFTR